MKFIHLLLCVAGVPLLASAQTERAMPAAADLKVPVTPLQYHSVFFDYVPLRDMPQSPDKDWVRANCALAGKFGELPASDDQHTAGPLHEMSMPSQMHKHHRQKGEQQ
jgi:hypothetical protein